MAETISSDYYVYFLICSVLTLNYSLTHSLLFISCVKPNYTYSSNTAVCIYDSCKCFSVIKKAKGGQSFMGAKDGPLLVFPFYYTSLVYKYQDAVGAFI
ncbi:hypothetical protein ABID22_003052 [Pontibacter aydingkolensis]